MGEVFIIDDDPSARRGLQRLVAALGHTAHAYASAEAFLADGMWDRGCILLDVRMPGMTGPALQERLLAGARALPIIFLSAHGDIPTVAGVMKRGAVHFLVKPVDKDELARAIDEALASDERERAGRDERAAARQRLADLTPREYEVLTHVITGRLNKQIAADLGVTEDTVKIHRSRMMQKVGLASVAELVRFCDQAGVAAAHAQRIG